jgi:hypothetical protein
MGDGFRYLEINLYNKTVLNSCYERNQTIGFDILT